MLGAKCLPFYEQGFSSQIPRLSAPRGAQPALEPGSFTQLVSLVENLTHLQWEPGGPYHVGTDDLEERGKKPFLIFKRVAFLL